MAEKSSLTATGTGALASADQAVIDDEMELSRKVARSVADSISGHGGDETQAAGPDVRGDLISLRDQISEARLEDVPALLTEMMRVAAVANVETPGRSGPVDGLSPYFGHLRLEETIPAKGGRKPRTSTRDVLIGKRGLVDREAGVVIVDWRNAPVSRLYYRYEEGDDYEEAFGDEEREGLVLVRRTVTFDQGRLLRVRTPETTYIRRDETEGDDWVSTGQGRVVELHGGAGKAKRAPARAGRAGRAPYSGGKRRRGPGAGEARLGHEGPSHLRPDKHLPEIAALIDPSQFEAMTQGDSGVVVLQGGAGSGKTTVALHRIAWLAFQDPQRFRPHRMLVTMKQPALVRYTERVLPSLDVAEVKVQAYGDFCKSALRFILPPPGQGGGPRREISDNTPPEITRLKKHPRMLLALKKQVARRLQETRAALEERTRGHDGAAQCLAEFDQRERKHAPLLVQLGDIWRGVDTCRAPADTRERARRAVESVRLQARNLIGEWEELITDQALLDTLLGSDVSKGDLANFLTWTSQQVEEPEEDDYDPEAKRPIDEDHEDDGPGYTLDVDDLPLLLNLWIDRTGALAAPRSGKTLTYDHIAVDEAQDLSAVEIRPLLVATGKNRSLTLAGDIVQKVVFDNGFDDWPELLEQLEVKGTMVEPFRLSYRSTAEVTEFAQHILGPLAHDALPSAIRGGTDVEIFSFMELGEEVAFLADALRGLMNREPNASVALLTRYPERAKFFHDLLATSEVPHLRLIEQGEFPFTPGVDVTHIEQAKGLEYDYVVLVEATAAMYPAENPARHLMHIGATRAAHQLWVTTQTKSLSPLLPLEMVTEL